MADGKYGTKSARLRSAERARTHAQGDEAFLANLARRKANKFVDERRYVIRSRDGDYFERWKSTGWETVKRSAHWTNDFTKAAQVGIDDLDSFGWIDLVCGFSGLKLVQI
jgi:hypothetical protein